MSFSRICAVLGTVATLTLVPPPAEAATVTETVERSVGRSSIRNVSAGQLTGRIVRNFDFQGSLRNYELFRFDKFSPELGTLTSVDVSFIAEWVNTGTMNTVDCRASGLLNSACEAESLVHTFRLVYGLTLPGGQRLTGTASTSAARDSIVLTSAADLAPYIGTGTFDIAGTYAPQLAPLIICDPNTATVILRCEGKSRRFWDGTTSTTVAFTFDPVIVPPPPPAVIPLPAGGALLLTALGLLGPGRRAARG